MGTDIHMIVERRETPDAPWVRCEAPWTCNECNGEKTLPAYGKQPPGARVECFWCGGKGYQTTFSDRNYSLFAQLAGVRNGKGFAGVDLGDGFDPISPPRGLPPEHAQYELCEDDEFIFGDHTFSWLLLSELLAYDTQRQTVQRGVVPVETLAIWDRKGYPPGEVCGDISGPRIVKTTDKHYRELSPEERARVTHVQVNWGRTYFDCCPQFWGAFVLALQKLGAPDCVRIVFGFDS